MRKEKGITLVSLVVTIIILIILAGVSINLLLGENGVITKSKEAKRAQEIAEIKEKLSLEIAAAETDAIIRNESLEQRQLEDIVNKYGTLQEDKDTIITKKNNYQISLKEIWYGVLSESGSYTDKVNKIEELEKEVEELNDIKKKLLNVTVTEDKILKDYIAYKDGELITGTIEDNGALNATLNAGESYTIPTGYTTGGTITASSLESQTIATAIASDIAEGKTAWVNGSQITGTASTSTAKTITFTLSYSGKCSSSDHSSSKTDAYVDKYRLIINDNGTCSLTRLTHTQTKDTLTGSVSASISNIAVVE